jgi:phage terminase large subunit
LNTSQPLTIDEPDPDELVIDTAPVFWPLLEPARYKGAYGGRGSAKSHFFAELLVDEALSFPGDAGEGMRAVCIREVQKTLKESAKRLIEDKIQTLGVGQEFRVYEDRIQTPGDGVIIFNGMVDHTSESIKSLEGYHRAWCEEAQSLSNRSLTLLRPTIRWEDTKRGMTSQIWASWNPRYPTDAIDIFLRQNAPPGSIVVESNWRDNPWFPKVLEDERQHDKASLLPEEYAHIWEGEYESVGDNQFIPRGIVKAAREADIHAEAHDELIMGVDVARMGADEIVFAVRRGRDATTEPWLFFRKMDTMETASRVAREIDRLGPDACFIDMGGVGAGVYDRLNQLGYVDRGVVIGVDSSRKSDGRGSAKTANKRAEMWQVMKDWLAQGQVSIPNDMTLEAQLTGVLYKHDTNNAILLERKDDPRRVKLGIPSPDRADALALTFAYAVAKRGERDWDYEEPRGRSGTTGY